MKYRFSPSQLGLFKDSPLDFWLDKKHKVARPRGIFPSLPSGVDRVLKVYFDKHRAAGTVPGEIDAPTSVRLYENQAQLDKWRNWRTGLEISIPEADARLGGALDDLMVTDDGLYVPTDYKSKGSPTTQEDSVKYYQHQLDCYALMLQESGMPVADFGILNYWSPLEAKKATLPGLMSFVTQTVIIPIDPSRARDMVCRAAACLDSNTPPPDEFENEYFVYFNKRKQLVAQFA